MEEAFHLDIFGQTPRLNIYTQLCFCLPAPAGEDGRPNPQAEAAGDVLAQGLKKLTQRLPWLAGKVVHEPPASSAKEDSGLFKIVPWADAPPLVVRDLRGDNSPSAHITMEGLQNAGFPMEMLDEAVIAPYMTIPGGIAGSGSAPTAVFAVQINHILGGILLTVVTHHQVMDLVGQVQIMRLLSKMCRGEEVSDDEVSLANADRRDVIPPLGAGEDDKPGVSQQLDRQVVKPSPPPVGASDPVDKPVVSVWASFSFSKASLAALKASALEPEATTPLAVPSPQEAKISTDDALTAFVWQSVTRARYRRQKKDNPTNPESVMKTTLGRAVDTRRYLNIPKEYPGAINNLVYLTHPIPDIVDNLPLGKIASELRQAIDPTTSQIGLYTQALAALLRRTPDKSVVSMGANIDPSTDLMISSWAGAGSDCYGMDFGLGLGPPVSVKRPRFYPVEGLGYLMPRRPSGEISLAICLREKDMTNLRLDEEFGRHATYIG